MTDGPRQRSSTAGSAKDGGEKESGGGVALKKEIGLVSACGIIVGECTCRWDTFSYFLWKLRVRQRMWKTNVGYLWVRATSATCVFRSHLKAALGSDPITQRGAWSLWWTRGWLKTPVTVTQRDDPLSDTASCHHPCCLSSLMMMVMMVMTSQSLTPLANNSMCRLTWLGQPYSSYICMICRE